MNLIVVIKVGKKAIGYRKKNKNIEKNEIYGLYYLSEKSYLNFKSLQPTASLIILHVPVYHNQFLVFSIPILPSRQKTLGKQNM